ncbi:hypothetical protein IBX65_00370 [Candidatus Aerophobetes bacterium]|nr:hypothetical protein [Candidatus Aerophobetes bacterium]
MSFVGIETFNPKRVIYLATKEEDLGPEDWCIFQSQEGWELGKIRFCVQKECPGEGRKVKRATLSDLEEFRKREKIAREAKELAEKKMTEYELPMKLKCTKYPLGKEKIIFYYTAKQRIDFRKLVKELAKTFKVRIQMQQIGVRDEPQIFGGIGICGREVCCASFLGRCKDKLESVALEAARIQNLPLVSSKISGICGRLRCCLNFEYYLYSNLVEEFPCIGKEMKIKGEKVKVVGCNLLTKTVIIETPDGVRKTVNKNELGEK